MKNSMLITSILLTTFFLPCASFSEPSKNATVSGSEKIQKEIPPANQPPVEAPPPLDPSKSAQLSAIQREIKWLESESESKRKEMNGATRDEMIELRAEWNDLDLRLKKARVNFIGIISEVELPSPEAETAPKKRDIIQELQQLVEPLLDAVRRVSEKPRRIEGYRTRQFEYQEQLQKTEKALISINRSLQSGSYPNFAKQLQKSKEDLEHSRDDLQLRVESLQRKLDQELGDNRTVVQVLSEATQGFIATKGKNLFIAFLVFFLVFWFLLYLKRFVFHPSRKRIQGIVKPLQLLYNLLAGFVSVISVIITLHLLNDYFLVTILVLLLFLFAWSSKALITHFISETKLALNLGPVKLGERVVWQGVPWLVKSLGFRSVLENEALEGGTIMLPASALTLMLSRSTVEGEPWFPTRVGDFVLLDDGNYGQVETQTPETVVVITGKTRKYYSTLNFLSKNPQNFSMGFQLEVEAVIRHTSPPLPLKEMEPILQKSIQIKLAARLKQEKPDFQNFQMFVVAPGLNLTRIFLRADCDGSLAAQRDLLRREMQSAGGEAYRDLEFGRN